MLKYPTGIVKAESPSRLDTFRIRPVSYYARRVLYNETKRHISHGEGMATQTKGEKMSRRCNRDCGNKVNILAYWFGLRHCEKCDLKELRENLGLVEARK